MTLPETQTLYFEDLAVGMRESYRKDPNPPDEQLKKAGLEPLK